MSERLSCFVIMPYSAESDRVYSEAIAPALMSIPDKKILVLRADQMGHEAITLRAHVENAVRSADFIITDVSGNNPNVMYELGYAAAIGKPVVIVSRKSLGELPANLRESPVLYYRDDELLEFKSELCMHVMETLSQLEMKPQEVNHIRSERGLSISLERLSLIKDFTGSIRNQFFALAGSPSWVSDVILPELVRRRTSGLVVRVVTANPEGEFTRMRSIDSGFPVTQYRAEMWAKIKRLQQELRLMKGIHAELRVTDRIVFSSVYLSDDIALVFPYLSSGRSRESAAVTVEQKLKPELYKVFREQFDHAWLDATSETLKFERPRYPIEGPDK